MSNDYEFEVGNLTVTYEIDGYKPMINGIYITGTGTSFDLTEGIPADRYDEIYEAARQDYIDRTMDKGD